jgi:hypothetical protein
VDAVASPSPSSGDICKGQPLLYTSGPVVEIAYSLSDWSQTRNYNYILEIALDTHRVMHLNGLLGLE